MSAAMHEMPIPPGLEDPEPLSPTILEQLDETLTIIDGDLDPMQALSSWSIDDDGVAEWALRHVATIDTDLADLAEKRDRWQAQIDHWFEQGSAVALRRRAFFQSHLIAYAARRREADPKAPKTLSLPSGRITSSDRSAVVRVTDDEKLAGWLRDHELTVGPDGADLMLTTTKVYAVPLRKVLRVVGSDVVIVSTGEKVLHEELPDGLTIDPAHTTYDVKPVLP